MAYLKKYFPGKSKPKSFHRKNSKSLSTNKDNNSYQEFSCTQNFFDFCSSTALHGLRFVGDTSLSNGERIFFAVAFILSFGMAIQFVYGIYAKWVSTPLILGFSASTTSINKFPFPSVTICNMNQAQRSKVENLKRNTMEYSILQTLCSREAEFPEELDSTKDWTNYKRFLIKVSQPCHKMLLSCQFGSFTENCSDIFRTVITDEGVCCAFNTVYPKFMYKPDQTIVSPDYDPPKDYVALHWTPEAGYPENLQFKYFPRTASGVGHNMGLRVVLNAQIDEYYCSSTNGPGFKMLLHNPVEAPNVGSTGVSVQIGYETRLVIKPELNVASDELKQMKMIHRRCIFENESNLTYYATYSRRNCELECEARILANKCNCVHYYMPRIPPNISVCGLKDAACFEFAGKKAQSLNDGGEFDCDKKCLNGCYELKFSQNAFTAPIGFENFSIEDPLIQGMSKDYVANNIAILNFYYVEKAFRSLSREEYIGLTDFLSSTGGIIGLFLGFSFISLVEIIYFLTMRPICACKRMQDKIIQNVQKNEPNSISVIFRQNYKQNLNGHHDSVINNIWRHKKNQRMFRTNRTLPGVLPYLD